MGNRCCSWTPENDGEIRNQVDRTIAEEAEIPSALKCSELSDSQASISTQASVQTLASSDKRKKLRVKKVSFELDDGTIYKGEWLDGMRDGRGMHRRNSSGRKYTGEWVLDQRHGFGK